MAAWRAISVLCRLRCLAVKRAGAAGRVDRVYW